MAARYHFVTELELGCPPDTVDATLRNVTAWPTWWKWARRVDPLDELPAGMVGARYRTRVRTPLRYGFTYDTEVVEVAAGRLRVDSSGDLEGTGLLTFRETEDGGTGLSFTWMVETTKWWMNLVAPVARPIFAWNHHRLMTDFARGLAGACSGELRSVEHTALTPDDPGFHRPGS